MKGRYLCYHSMIANEKGEHASSMLYTNVAEQPASYKVLTKPCTSYHMCRFRFDA